MLAGQLDTLRRTPKAETPAERSRRTADIVKVSRELRGLLAKPTRAPVNGGGDDDDSGTPAVPDGDAVDRELAGIVGAGAEVGDPADA